MTALDERVERSYTAFGELSSESLSGRVLCFTYDTLGRRIKTELPDDSDIAYVYLGGRLHEIRRGPYLHRYTEHDGWGLPTKQELSGRAGSVQCARDLLGRVVRLSSPHFEIRVPEGGYDRAGRLSLRHVRDAKGSYNQAIDYDPWYQVASERGAFHRDYSNDSLSNVHSRSGDEREFNALNQITKVDSTSYAYDLNGNLIRESSPQGERYFSYDALDRLVSVRDGELCAHFDKATVFL